LFRNIPDYSENVLKPPKLKHPLIREDLNVIPTSVPGG